MAKTKINLKIKASKFKNRPDLENEVRNRFGLTTAVKDCVIEGKKKDLARLHLSDKTTFWGIRVKCLDFPSKPKKKIKVARGKKFKSKI